MAARASVLHLAADNTERTLPVWCPGAMLLHRAAGGPMGCLAAYPARQYMDRLHVETLMLKRMDAGHLKPGMQLHELTERRGS